MKETDAIEQQRKRLFTSFPTAIPITLTLIGPSNGYLNSPVTAWLP